MNASQLESYVRDGFVILQNVIDPNDCDRARAVVNNELGKPCYQVEENKRFAAITSHPDLIRLYNGSPRLLQCIRSLLGIHPTNLMGCQVALRFPGNMCMQGGTEGTGFVPVPWWTQVFHIDGIGDKGNNIPLGEVRNFTLLIGIPIADVKRELAGNLVVFPESHWETEQFFRDSGGVDIIKTEGMKGLRPPLHQKPKCVVLSAGDAVVAHYSLCHSIAPNVTPDIRYQLYFRLNVRSHNVCHPEPMLNIWLDYSEEVKRMGELHRREREARGIQSNVNQQVLTAGYVDTYEPSSTPTSSQPQNQSHNARLSDMDMVKIRSLIHAHKWAEVAPMLEDFMKRIPNLNWEIHIFAAISYTWHPDISWTVKGEKLLRGYLVSYRGIPSIPSLLAQNLLRQAREHPSMTEPIRQKIKDEVCKLVTTAICECAKADDSNFVKDCFHSAVKAGMDLPSLVQLSIAATTKYPTTATAVKEIIERSM
eukprot:PhF_6_TR13017/c0_g1_i1/m.20629